MAAIEIDRPKPKWRAHITWAAHNERDQRSLYVHTGYAADTPAEPVQAAPDAFWPNNISLNQGTAEIRLTRAAAEELRDALTAALEWDGN